MEHRIDEANIESEGTEPASAQSRDIPHQSINTDQKDLESKSDADILNRITELQRKVEKLSTQESMELAAHEEEKRRRRLT
jgi:hypothetical protein